MTNSERDDRDQLTLQSYPHDLDRLELAPVYDDALRRGPGSQRVCAGQPLRRVSPGDLAWHKKAQRDDLALFSRFLADLGISRSPDELFSDARAWKGMSASLLVAFRHWLLYKQPGDERGEMKGYAIGSVRRRMSTVKQYCRLAFQSQVLPHSEWALLQAVKAPSHAAGENIDADREEQGIAPRISSRKPYATVMEAKKFTELRHTTTDIKRYREHDVILSERDELLICLLGEHGLRVSEVVSLDTISIDLVNDKLTVKRRKTHEQATLKLLPATRKAAALYLPLLGSEGVRTGRPLFEGYRGKRVNANRLLAHPHKK